MKIGLLTFTDGTNLGQRLQNYALQTTLRDMGLTVRTIEQVYPHNRFKYIVKEALDAIKKPSEFICYKKRSRSFKQFNKKNIDFYSRKLSFFSDNRWIAEEFDAFIVGSDQIWNPKSPFVGDNFFLKFARPEQRYTYAPSFSVEEIPDNMKKVYSERLSGFSSISIREDRGAEIVKALTGREAVVVLDPTLLVTRKQWDNIKEKSKLRKDKAYILSVFLGSSYPSEIYELSQKLGIALIELENSTVINPSEFLDLVEHSTLVLTDSYHITIFSIIYHKPFINFERKCSIDMNSRFQTLYNKLGITNRQWSYLKDNFKDLLNIDFLSIDKKIAIEKKKSLEFLRKTIGKVAEDL